MGNILHFLLGRTKRGDEFFQLGQFLHIGGIGPVTGVAFHLGHGLIDQGPARLPLGLELFSRCRLLTQNHVTPQARQRQMHPIGQLQPRDHGRHAQIHQALLLRGNTVHHHEIDR